MAKAGASDASAQAPLLLPQPPPSYGVPIGSGGGYYQEPPAQPYLIVPVLSRRRRRSGACCASLLSSSSLLALFSAAVVIGAAAFFLWPSDPDVSLSRLGLRSVHVSTDKHGGVSLDFDMDLVVRVRNPDFFALDYDEIKVGIGYRGRRLGTVTADGGHVRARGVSYVDARLRLDGIRVFQDAFYLIQDLRRGKVPFDTVTEVEGQLRLFGIDIPLEVADKFSRKDIMFCGCGCCNTDHCQSNLLPRMIMEDDDLGGRRPMNILLQAQDVSPHRRRRV